MIYAQMAAAPLSPPRPHERNSSYFPPTPTASAKPSPDSAYSQQDYFTAPLSRQPRQPSVDLPQAEPPAMGYWAQVWATLRFCVCCRD